MKIEITAESNDEDFTELTIAMELRHIADRVAYGETKGTMQGPNGGDVGKWELTE